MSQLKEKIIEDKFRLSEDALELAQSALNRLAELVDEGMAPRDLVAVFNSAVKTHRDLTADLRKQDDEEKSEKDLAKDEMYVTKVDQLIEGIKRSDVG